MGIFKGLISEEIAEILSECGYEVYNLVGGYGEWLIKSFENENSRVKDIENSIRKKFHKSLFSKFAKGINTYELLQELKRHNKFNFELVFMVMDPGYNDYNRQIIEKNAEILNYDIIFLRPFFCSWDC